MDRRKDNPRVPLWIRSSSEDQGSGTSGGYRSKPYWSPPQHEQRQRSEWPSRPLKGKPRSSDLSQKKKRGSSQKRRQYNRPPRYETVATERITLRNPVHLEDWGKRTEIIDDHTELVQKTQQSGQAPWPIQVWKIGDEYVLARGFASLAAAVDADLEQIRVVVAARFPRWELTWVDPQDVKGPDPLLSKALHARKKVQELGWVFPPLSISPEEDDGQEGAYSLGRGKRAAARLWAAQEEGLEMVPAVIRPQPRQTKVAGTVHLDIERIQITSSRHKRKMHKSIPLRLITEAAQGRVKPIRVRRTISGDYQLVDGLLRLRAAKEAGLSNVYAIVEIEPTRG